MTKRSRHRVPAQDAPLVATAVPSAAAAVAPCGPRQRWLTAVVGAGVFLATFAVFLPALRNGFVDWDDPANFLRNENYRGLCADQLRWMFTTFHFGHYQPLSWITAGLDYIVARALFGDGLDPRSYHFTNNLLHAGSAVLAFLLARRLLAATQPGRSRRGGSLALAAVAALLFSVHPLRAESVAWITERRDVLSSFLLLLAVLLYLRAHDPGAARWTWLGVALGVYTLSLLSRALGVMLPLVLLLLDWYPLRRFAPAPGDAALAEVRGRRHRTALPTLRGIGVVLLEKLPFFVLAVIFAIVALKAQASAGATYDLTRHGPAERLAQACYGLVFYLHKTLLPLGLSPIYEVRLPIDVSSPRYTTAFAVVIALLGLLGALVVTRRGRGVLLAAGCYALLVLPVSGLAQSGNQEVADRYSYLPGVVLAILAAAGLSAALRRWPAHGRYAVAGVPAIVIVVLATMTWRQVGVWRSTATLWTHAARVQPGSSIAQNGCGFVLLEAQRYDEALVHLRRALEIQPANTMAHENLWRLWRDQSRHAALLAELQRSIETYPSLSNERYVRAWHARVISLLRQPAGLAEAVAHYRASNAATKLSIWRTWTSRMHAEKKYEREAIDALRLALRIDPQDPQSRQLWQAWTNTPPP